MSDAGAKAQPGETISVVEDEELVLEFLLDVLREAQFEVLGAGDGTQALEILGRADQRVDLLLSDVALPGLTGRELVTQAARIRPGLKALFMTGYSREVMTRQGWILGNSMRARGRGWRRIRGRSAGSRGPRD